MTTYAANPYELWTTRNAPGRLPRLRSRRPGTSASSSPNQMRSTDEWIDFEKLPVRSRKLAPFVKPMGRGHGVFTDKVQGYRFKPANLVVEDSVDPLASADLPAGHRESMYRQQRRLTPMQRLELIKAQMLDGDAGRRSSAAGSG
jgi:hypothetical protein